MVFAIWAANLWVLGELFLLAFIKMPSLLLQKHSWWKKQFCSKNFIFVSFEICESFSSSCRQCYGRLAKISLCLFRRTFQRITFLESAQLFHPYRNSSKNFQSSDEKILTECGHNCTLHAHRHFLRKVIFFSRNS